MYKRQRLKKCFPRGILPTWAEIEAFASKELSKDLEFTRAFLTNSIGIQFGPLASIKKFISEAFLRYEAGFQKGIVKSMKPGERVRVIVVAGVDGFNCKHFVSPLVGGYLCYALLPAYGGERLVDIYGGDHDKAKKRNSGAHLNMMDPAIIFARGDNFCNMQCNLTDVPAEWMDPEATLAVLDGFSAPQMRDAAHRYGLSLIHI